MKLKKLIYILLVIMLLPCFAAAEEYPLLPTFLKEKVIAAFGINTAGKTMLYEKVNIYEDFDAWMIGWFDNTTKIITGITDTEDIIYYNISGIGNTQLQTSGNPITAREGEKVASDFLKRIMPVAEPVLTGSKAFEYTFADSCNSIPILGREATVVVDKFSGKVIYYKGFGQTECGFIKLSEGMITPEHAFEKFYENIGLELVYNIVFDHSARTKAVRPMYILNRSDYRVVDAESGKIVNIAMLDYNYYYNDDFFNPNYYYDNNIYTDELLFTPDGSVSASGYKISDFLNMPGLNLSEGYCARVVPGKLSYYTGSDGYAQTRDALRLDIVPTSHAIDIYKFCDKFDSGNPEWFKTVDCDTPLVFARAYVDAHTGRLLDFESVKNASFTAHTPIPVSSTEIDAFVRISAGDEALKYYGMQNPGDGLSHIVYARYSSGARVIGEGASVIYDESLGSITDYTLSVSDTDFLSPAFMKTPEQMKELVKKELSLSLFYVDKNKHSKFVVYDVNSRNIAFDPLTGDRVDRLENRVSPIIVVCTVGETGYTLNGSLFTAPAPTISFDKLYVPVSVIAAALGYTISAEQNGVVLSDGKETVTLFPDNSICLLNSENFTLDSPPISRPETTYVSAGTLRSLFGMFIRWDSDTGKIYLIK